MYHHQSSFLVLMDESELWLEDVIHRHHEEARRRVDRLLEDAQHEENGCLVTDTTYPRKVTFMGRQTYAYRFIHCVLEKAIAGQDQVVRHRCHNRLCINPMHLELGSQADNKRDDWEHWAGGTDPDFL